MSLDDRRGRKLPEIAAVLPAAALCAAVVGYTFGGGNHEVYLLAPLRTAGLATFAGDWFLNDTLQYHGLFSLIAAALFRLGVAEAGFFTIYAGLAVALAWAWWRICRSLGGTASAFALAVVVYHALMGDRALGVYSLLQDGQFNAANVAAVALVIGLAMWLENRLVWAGAAFGVAGAFHLNYAVVCPALWVGLLAWGKLPACLAFKAASPDTPSAPRQRRRWQAGSLPHGVATLLAVLPAVLNVGRALPSKLTRDAGEMLSLPRFVELYAVLRHPHHYAPATWPWWVWAAFLLPVPLAAWLFWRNRAAGPWRRAGVAWLLLMGLQGFAGLTAGLFWLGGTFIQLSLWRFSPHAKLLAVTAVCAWLVNQAAAAAADNPTNGEPRLPPRLAHATGRKLVVAAILFALGVGVFACGIAGWASVTLGFGLIAAMLLIVLSTTAMSDATGKSQPIVLATAAFAASMGLLSSEQIRQPGRVDADPAVLEAAAWARANTDEDALFLVPPGAGSAFPVNARRSHVVSFKLVPQLSDGLVVWADRIADVLDVPDLDRFAGGGFTGYHAAQRAMDARYAELPASHLFDVARRFGARYVVTTTPLPDAPTRAEIWRGRTGGFVYDVPVSGP